jgi:hypothetical protein
MVPYMPEKFYFADVRPKEAEKLREGPDSHPNSPFLGNAAEISLSGNQRPGSWVI